MKRYLTTKTVLSSQMFCMFKLIRNCKKSTFFWDSFLLSDCPFIIITVLLHKATERWKYCQHHPKNSLEFQCLSDERAYLIMCLHISLAAVCLCVYTCVPLFPSFCLTVFVVPCLSCTLPVDLHVCRSTHGFPQRIRLHVKGNQADRETALKSSYRPSSAPLYCWPFTSMVSAFILSEQRFYPASCLVLCQKVETKAMETLETKALWLVRPLLKQNSRLLLFD